MFVTINFFSAIDFTVKNNQIIDYQDINGRLSHESKYGSGGKSK